MGLKSFIEKFNQKIITLDSTCKISISEAGKNENFQNLFISENIALVAHINNEQLDAVNVLADRCSADNAIKTLKVICVVVDVYTGEKEQWRNGVLERIGLFNGNFAAGEKTESRGYLLKTKLEKNKLWFSISTI